MAMYLIGIYFFSFQRVFDPNLTLQRVLETWVTCVSLPVLLEKVNESGGLRYHDNVVGVSCPASERMVPNERPTYRAIVTLNLVGISELSQNVLGQNLEVQTN
jgi:hypothetical protein